MLRCPQASPPKTGEREISGERALTTWVSSFVTYVAIVSKAHPERVADMLAYMRLIVREASKFGGNGWLTYDSVFRRNPTGSSSPWNSLDASLHKVYTANQPGKMCPPASTATRSTIKRQTVQWPLSYRSRAANWLNPGPRPEIVPPLGRENAPFLLTANDRSATRGMAEIANFLGSVHMCTSALCAMGPI